MLIFGLVVEVRTAALALVQVGFQYNGHILSPGSMALMLSLKYIYLTVVMFN